MPFDELHLQQVTDAQSTNCFVINCDFYQFMFGKSYNQRDVKQQTHNFFFYIYIICTCTHGKTNTMANMRKCSLLKATEQTIRLKHLLCIVLIQFFFKQMHRQL